MIAVSARAAMDQNVSLLDVTRSTVPAMKRTDEIAAGTMLAASDM